MKRLILLSGLLLLFAACQSQTRLDFDITSIREVDSLRVKMNSTSLLSTKRSGDEFVFKAAMDFVLSGHDSLAELRFTRNWNNPLVPKVYDYWNDVRYLYKYFAGLNAEKLFKQGLLKSKDSVYINKYEDFSHAAKPLAVNEIKTGSVQQLTKNVWKKEVLRNGIPVGFLIEGTGLKLDFIFRGNERIRWPELDQKYNTIVADFPLPMHTGGGKLLELGIQDGEVINYIFSGGNRRSGMVVIDQKGNSYPFHIERIKPSLWSEKYDPKMQLDLAHNVNDLVKFLDIAKKDHLDVVMEMLILDSTEGLSVRSIKDSTEKGGRRMLLWRAQDSSGLALLVLKDGYFTDVLTETACALGFQWGIYCDVNFYDNAGYWVNDQHRIRFSFYEETENGQPKWPYHRMVLYKL